VLAIYSLGKGGAGLQDAGMLNLRPLARSQRGKGVVSLRPSLAAASAPTRAGSCACRHVQAMPSTDTNGREAMSALEPGLCRATSEAIAMIGSEPGRPVVRKRMPTREQTRRRGQDATAPRVSDVGPILTARGSADRSMRPSGACIGDASDHITATIEAEWF